MIFPTTKILKKFHTLLFFLNYSIPPTDLLFAPSVLSRLFEQYLFKIISLCSWPTYSISNFFFVFIIKNRPWSDMLNSYQLCLKRFRPSSLITTLSTIFNALTVLGVIFSAYLLMSPTEHHPSLICSINRVNAPKNL